MAMSMTRQNFLAVTAAAGVLGLGAAAGITTSNATAEEAPTTGLPDTVAPIPPVSAPETWDYETDVIVVGTGGAGGTAAVTAFEEGASVLIIERGNVWGGDTQCATLWGGNPEASFEDRYASYHRNAIHHEVAKAMAENLPDDFAWMAKHGEGYMKFVPDRSAAGFALTAGWTPWPANYEEPENATFAEEGWYQWFPHNASAFTNTLLMAAERYEIPTLYETRVTALVEEDGVVLGVQAEQADGSVIYAKAPATILATGGYTANWDMLKHYLPEDRYPGLCMYEGTPIAQGDGIRMAQGIGARVMDLDKNAIWDGGVYDPKHMGPSLKYSAANQMNRWPSLTVNVWAQRFMNEKDGNFTNQEDIRRTQPQAITFTILDSTMVDPAAAIEMFTLSSCEFPSPLFGRFFEQQLADGVIMGADTIEELADLMKVDPETLVATVNRYNELCEKGVDEDFYKPADMMHPIATPPFYATKSKGGESWCTYGGICYDGKLHVIDEYGNPIPGLFCAGETARYLGAVSNAIGSGRHAGRMAAREVLDGTTPAVGSIPPAAAEPEDGSVDTTNWWSTRATIVDPGDGCLSCHGAENFHERPADHEGLAGDSCMTCHDYVEFGRETTNPTGAPIVPHTVPGVSTQIG